MSIQDCLKNACDSIREDAITAQAAATQAQAARDNLPNDVDGSKTLTYREEMPDNTDLNSKTTTGLYGQTSSSQATLDLNYPTTLAGMLEVTTSVTMVYQKYSTYSIDKVFVRSLQNGNWTEWKQIATSDSLYDFTRKTVYISSTGDDSNTGLKSSEPVKTLKKAVDSVPFGGFIKVVFLSDISFIEDIITFNKTIIISLGDYRLLVDAPASGSGYINKFKGNNNYISINASSSATPNLILPSSPDGAPSNYVYGSLVSSYYSWRDGRNNAMHLRYINVGRDDYGYLLDCLNGTCSFSVYSSTITDTAGLDLKDMVTGIVRNTDGVINVLSNITL